MPAPTPNSKTTTDNGIHFTHQITRPALTTYLPEPSDETGSAMIFWPEEDNKINAPALEGHAVGRQRALQPF